MPGVLRITADPWGYNEQNAQIFIHGFAANQLGYTMDGIPLGDQSYGNYNGLSPQRAVISENVGRVVVSTGAGNLATASNSNPGGTIETYSSNPLETLGIQDVQTVGSQIERWFDRLRDHRRITIRDHRSTRSNPCFASATSTPLQQPFAQYTIQPARATRLRPANPDVPLPPNISYVNATNTGHQTHAIVYRTQLGFDEQPTQAISLRQGPSIKFFHIFTKISTSQSMIIKRAI